MSWFHHVNQDSNQQGQYPFGNRGLSSANASCSGFNPCTRGPTVESPTVANEQWGRRSTLGVFPSVPADSPPSLEKLSGFSPNAARVRDSGPVSYSLQEQRCVLSWFSGWNQSQRERFLQDLLGKAVPGKVCTLLDSLSTLQVPCALTYICTYDFVEFNREANCMSVLISRVRYLSRLRTNYRISLNASCACGPSGFSPGEKMRGIISCTCWKSRIPCLFTSFTGA